MNRSHRLACALAGMAAAALAPLLAVPAAQADVISDNLSAYTGRNAQGYLGPLKESIGQALNSGIYSSGFVPPGGIYVRVEAKAFRVNYEDADRTFRARTEDFFPASQDVEAPTIIGSTDGVVVSDPGTGAIYNLPGGLDVDRLTLGVPQITVGSLAGFELTGRFLALDVGDTDLGNIKLYGGGVRYGLSAPLKLPFDLTAMVFYQKFKLGDDFVDSNALTYGLQGGYRLPMLDLYAGLAMDRYKMDVTYESDLSDAGGKTTISLPAENDFHVSVGATFHLAVLHLNAEFNHAARSSFAVGVGIGNR